MVRSLSGSSPVDYSAIQKYGQLKHIHSRANALGSGSERLHAERARGHKDIGPCLLRLDDPSDGGLHRNLGVCGLDSSTSAAASGFLPVAFHLNQFETWDRLENLPGW